MGQHDAHKELECIGFGVPVQTLDCSSALEAAAARQAEITVDLSGIAIVIDLTVSVEVPPTWKIKLMSLCFGRMPQVSLAGIKLPRNLNGSHDLIGYTRPLTVSPGLFITFKQIDFVRTPLSSSSFRTA